MEDAMYERCSTTSRAQWHSDASCVSIMQQTLADVQNLFHLHGSSSYIVICDAGSSSLIA